MRSGCCSQRRCDNQQKRVGGIFSRGEGRDVATRGGGIGAGVLAIVSFCWAEATRGLWVAYGRVMEESWWLGVIFDGMRGTLMCL